MDQREKKALLRKYAEEYNRKEYFIEDPIAFPAHFAEMRDSGRANIKDVECAAVIAAHLAWGRRDMIVRDCRRAMDEMEWKPYDYVMKGEYRRDRSSLHRTVMWSDFAGICNRLHAFYTDHDSLEELSPDRMRVEIYGQKSDLSCANKKIHMLRRWMVRDDGIVDLGVWKNISPAELIIPLDVHVHKSARNLEITDRKSADYKTAYEITEYLKEVFPGDPAKGDFALFAASVNGNI